jgi:hypothetical protein
MCSHPKFIGIGAIKSGTTWLHQALGQHPGAWVPYVKELRYFNQPEYNLLQRLRGGTAGRYDYGYWQRQLLQFLRHPGIRRSDRLRYIAWHLFYFFWPRSPRWYTSLFPSDDRVTGEITPLYAPIPEDKIERAARHFPDLKLIYLLRDPIARLWSHIRMRCLGLPNVDFNADRLTEELILHTIEERDLNDRWLFRHSRYAATLDRWLRFFPREQLFVGYLHDIKTQPQTLLRELGDFLGLAPEDFDHDTLLEKHNPKPIDMDLPPVLETIFARRLLDDLRDLDDQLNDDPVTAWRERAERAAQRPVPTSSRFAGAAAPVLP